MGFADGLAFERMERDLKEKKRKKRKKYNTLYKHVGHKIVCVAYGDQPAKFGDLGQQNVTIECKTCGKVLLNIDKDWE